MNEKARLYCTNCNKDANLNDVEIINANSRPNCDRCREALNFVCTFCEKTTFGMRMMYCHLTSGCKSTPAKFRCTKCSHRAKTKANLMKHIISKHEKKKCRGCGRNIGTYRGLLHHQSSKCPYEPDANFGRKLSCDICGYFAQEKSSLRRHMTKIHNF